MQSIKARYEGVKTQCADIVEKLEIALPLAETFRDSHDKLMACLQNIDAELKTMDPLASNVEELLEVILFILTNRLFLLIALWIDKLSDL